MSFHPHQLHRVNCIHPRHVIASVIKILISPVNGLSLHFLHIHFQATTTTQLDWWPVSHSTANPRTVFWRHALSTFPPQWSWCTATGPAFMRVVSGYSCPQLQRLLWVGQRPLLWLRPVLAVKRTDLRAPTMDIITIIRVPIRIIIILILMVIRSTHRTITLRWVHQKISSEPI